MTKRIEWIDASKGILIALVVFHHYATYARAMGVEMGGVKHVFLLNNIFVPFFMQAFFFITGYTSSYKKPIKEFVIKNAKSLLFPILFFGVTLALSEKYISHIQPSILFIEKDGQKIPFLLECYWFLHALFISKIIMYGFVNHIKTVKVQFVLALALLVVAMIVNDKVGHLHNWLHWRNSFCMFIFLWMGFVCKKYELIGKLERYKWIIYAAYIIPIVLAFVIQKNIGGYIVPQYTHSPSFGAKSIPLYLYFALLGSISIVYVSKGISNNLVKYMGQNSLTIYGCHFVWLQLSIMLYRSLLGTSSNSAIFLLLSLATTYLLCLLTCKVFSVSPAKYLIGKF